MITSLEIENVEKVENLIPFDPFWTDMIQSDQKINKVENLMIYFNDYFIRNPISSILIYFGRI